MFSEKFEQINSFISTSNFAAKFRECDCTGESAKNRGGGEEGVEIRSLDFR